MVTSCAVGCIYKTSKFKASDFIHFNLFNCKDHLSQAAAIRNVTCNVFVWGVLDEYVTMMRRPHWHSNRRFSTFHSRGHQKYQESLCPMSLRMQSAGRLLCKDNLSLTGLLISPQTKSREPAGIKPRVL